MNAEQKLIIGLGQMFVTQSNQNHLMPSKGAHANPSTYAAVCVYSSQEPSVDPLHQFLDQPHCVDLRRHLLNQLLPFLDKQATYTNQAPFFDFNMSRRYARLLFSHHQDWFWSSIVTSLRESDISQPVNVVMMVDMADSFANAVWVDCLFGLKQRYPDTNIYPVFFLPQIEELDVEEAAIIGAAVTELSQLSQAKWTPTDINSGQPYPCGEPLWAMAYLQQCPERNTTTDYLRLIDSLLVLSNVEHNDYGTLRHSLTQEYQKIFNQNSTKSTQLLPRFGSMLDIQLNLDVVTLQKMLESQCQSKLLTTLSHTPAQTNEYDIEKLDALGYVLTPEQLRLNEDSCGVQLGKIKPIEAEWEQFKSKLLLHCHVSNDDWYNQAEHIASNLRSYYDKQFRVVGVEKYYEHSDARLNKMAKAHVAKIEAYFWQAWQEGRASLTELQSAIEGLIIYYVQVHQQYLMEQESSIEQVKQCAAWWENISGHWQRESELDRCRIEDENSIVTVAEKMEQLFVQRCHYKANVFAERLILGMQPYLIDLQQQLYNASEAWVHQATQTQKQLNQSMATQNEQWLMTVEGVCNSYMIEPNNTSLQLFSDAVREKAECAAVSLKQRYVENLDVSAKFAGLSEQIKSPSWQTQLQEMAENMASDVLSEQAEILHKIFEHRITELNQKQVQYLGKNTLKTLTEQFRNLLQPLGDMLTTKYTVNESACLLCEGAIPKSDLVSSWLAQYVQQSLPNAKLMSLKGEMGMQFAYARSCYLDEWVDLPDFLNAYRQFNFNEEALLHLHIDGSNEAITVMQKNSINRNRELIRQHLLLAYLAGELVFEPNSYSLNIAHCQTHLSFETEHLSDVVDYVAFEHIEQLIVANDKLRQAGFFGKDIPELFEKLDGILENIKQVSLPVGVALEDADWADAGRYVVWSRAAHYIRKQWLKEAKSSKGQKVA